MRFLVGATYVATCSNLATSEGLTMKKPKRGAVTFTLKSPGEGRHDTPALFLGFPHSSERRPASARSHMARGFECRWKGHMQKIKESHMCVCFSSLDKHKLLLSRLKPMLLEKMDTVQTQGSTSCDATWLSGIVDNTISHGTFCRKGFSVRSSQITDSHNFHFASYLPQTHG